MRYSTIFFDLDDTLYDSRSGLWDAIRHRMSEYMQERLGMPWDEIDELRKKYYQTYGTTLRGLQRHHQVDSDDFLAYVHDLPLDQYLEPAPELGDLLRSMPQQKWVFTNADANHAHRVLSHLELADYFDGVIDLRAMQFACKPERAAYERALAITGNPLPEACVMLDDAVINLAAAQGIGFTPVWVTRNGQSSSTAMYTISSIMDLPDVMPELWQA